MPSSRDLAGAVAWHSSNVSRAARWNAYRLAGATIWLTGLPASGKSTVACEVERWLVSRGRAALVLDGDDLRRGLTRDLGFSAPDRRENVRRAGEAALLLAEAGVVAVVSLISPYAADRKRVRDQHADAELPFVEVWVNTPLCECERRDPKGHYARARSGQLRGFTGVDDPYEPPVQPEVELTPADGSPASQAKRVVAGLDAINARPARAAQDRA